MRVAGLILLAVLAAGCAAKTVWLDGHPPAIDDYPAVHVRIYHVGSLCRLEVITDKDTIITLPTRCVIAPHITRP